MAHAPEARLALPTAMSRSQCTHAVPGCRRSGGWQNWVWGAGSTGTSSPV